MTLYEAIIYMLIITISKVIKRREQYVYYS